MINQVEASTSILLSFLVDYMVDRQTVYVDMIIDDRQNYGKIFIR